MKYISIFAMDVFRREMCKYKSNCKMHIWSSLKNVAPKMFSLTTYNG